MFPRVAFAVIYTLVFLGIVFITIGAGEGTMLFASALFSWPLIFICIIILGRKDTRSSFVALMILHYILTGIIAFSTDHWLFIDTRSYAGKYPVAFVFAIFWYLAGQIVLWRAFITETSRSK